MTIKSNQVRNLPKTIGVCIHFKKKIAHITCKAGELNCRGQAHIATSTELPTSLTGIIHLDLTCMNMANKEHQTCLLTGKLLEVEVLHKFDSSKVFFYFIRNMFVEYIARHYR